MQHGRNVQMEFKWQKTPSGNYFVSSYVVDEVNDQQLNLSAVYYLEGISDGGGRGNDGGYCGGDDDDFE